MLSTPTCDCGVKHTGGNHSPWCAITIGATATILSPVPSAAKTSTYQVPTWDISGGGYCPGVTNLTCGSLFEGLATLGRLSVEAYELRVTSKLLCHIRGQGDVIYVVPPQVGKVPAMFWHGLELTVDPALDKLTQHNVYTSEIYCPFKIKLLKIVSREY